jgi:hypothetical protein
MRRLTVLALGFAIPFGGTDSARNPWDLQCPSMPTERRAPPALHQVASAFFPWVGSSAADGLQSGPIRLFALSSRTAISRDGDERDGAGYYRHRALLAVAPSYKGTVTITGHRLGRSERRTTLGFSTNGATHCTVSTPVVSCGKRPLRFAPSLRIAPRPGWRVVETELRIGRTGCFQLAATGPGLRATIPLAVPGPDWGTSGW